MVRVTKDPEERKSEIMSTAIQLFIEKGFEQTAVSDIVKKIGVAQGTFYYYFESKDELLNEILAQFLNSLIQGMENIVKNDEFNVLQKLQQIIKMIFSIGQGYEGPMFEYIHEEKNMLMHHKLTDKALEMLSPIFLQIIEDGRNQGLFNIDYPEEALEILLHGSIDYIHKFYFCKDRDIYTKKVEALIDTFERIFGAEKGSLKTTIVL